MKRVLYRLGSRKFRILPPFEELNLIHDHKLQGNAEKLAHLPRERSVAVRNQGFVNVRVSSYGNRRSGSCRSLFSHGRNRGRVQAAAQEDSSAVGVKAASNSILENGGKVFY